MAHRGVNQGKHVLVSGGGSGGHVFPGLAVAEELRRRGWRVSWAGSERGLEARLVAKYGVDFHALPARPVLGQGPAGKALAGWTLARSAWSARRLVRRLDVSAVVGTGGYVSVPAVLGARLASRPVLLVEPNAEVGLANRFLSRLASAAATAYDETARQLRCPSHTTGVPVRPEFFAAGPPADGPLRLLAVGGSQGARQINELVPAALARLESRDEIFVVHQAGARLVDETRASYAAADLPPYIRVEILPFLDDMPAALASARLIVSRAGAITLAEICAAGRASLLVPLRIAGGHQVDNALRLLAAGAAEVLLPDAADEAFHSLLRSLTADPERLAAMGAAARSLAHEGAASAIADQVERLAGHPPAATADGGNG